MSASLHGADPVDPRTAAPVSGPVLAAVSGVLQRLTGRCIDTEDLDAELDRDFGLDLGNLCVLAWDAAGDLGWMRRSEQLAGPALRRLQTVADLVELLSANEPRAPRSSGDLTGVKSFVECHLASRGGSAFSGGEIAGPASGCELEFPMPVEILAGTPVEMGRAYGKNQALNIFRIIDRQISLLGYDRLRELPELQQALNDPRLYFGNDEIREIEAIAASCEVTPDFIFGHNLGLYPDYIPGCTQFAVTARRNPEFGLIHCVNEDSPISLRIREDLTRVMSVRRPVDGIANLTFGIAGQVGGLNGINAAGLMVSTTLLLDRPLREENQFGIIHPILVKRILESAGTIPEALEVIRGTGRNSAWSMCLSHFPTDSLCYVEYDGASLKVAEDVEELASANHSLLHEPIVPRAAHSESRLTRLTALLNRGPHEGLSPEWARKVLRDKFDLARGRETPFPTMHTVRRVDNQGSIVFVPAAGELWVTAGPMAPDAVDRYFRVSLAELLGGVFAAKQLTAV